MISTHTPVTCDNYILVLITVRRAYELFLRPTHFHKVLHHNNIMFFTNIKGPTHFHAPVSHFLSPHPASHSHNNRFTLPPHPNHERSPAQPTATASQLKQWPGVLAANKSNLNLHLLHFATVPYFALLRLLNCQAGKIEWINIT